MAHLLESNFAETFSLVNKSSDSAEKFRSANERLLGEWGKPAAEMMKSAIDAIIESLSGRFPASEFAKFNHLHSIFMEMDNPAASCQIFADGSGLVRVHSSLYSLCEHLQAISGIWLHSADPDFEKALLFRKQEIGANGGEVCLDDTLAACTAALRYYLIHQRVWGISSKIVPNENTIIDQTVLLGWHAFRFIVAHEASHFLLNHGSSSSTQASDLKQAHEIELSADSYAFDLLRREFITDNPNDKDIATQSALTSAQLALLVVAVSDTALYIRPPNSHPAFSDRNGHLRNPNGLGNSEDGAVMLLFAGIARTANVASDFSTSLPDSYWDKLFRSEFFDTTRHSSAYFSSVRHLDRYLSMSWMQSLAEAHRLQTRGLPDFRPGLESLREGQVGDALRKWRVKQPEQITDPRRTLSHLSLVKAIASCGLYADTTDESADFQTLKSFMAALCASRIHQHYRENGTAQ